MGIFAGLTASAFRQEGEDVYLLAPGKPRRYLSHEDYERARSRLETMYMIGLPLIVVLVGVGRQFGYIWPIGGGLLMLGWFFLFGLPILKRNTVLGDIEDEDAWQNKPGRCRLVVDGVRHIEGQCDVALLADGSFKIVATNGYAAMVDREGSTAQGSWNGDPESMYLGEELGNLTRRGACWVNERTEICAWE